MGSSTEKVQSFANNVFAFQNGESLKLPSKDDDSTKKNQEAEAIAAPTFDSKPSSVPVISHAKSSSQPQKEEAQPKKLESKKKISASATTKAATLSAKKDSPASSTLSTAEPFPEQKEDKTETVKKSTPQKGKPSFVCGCYGTKHKPLANCLVYEKKNRFKRLLTINPPLTFCSCFKKTAVDAYRAIVKVMTFVPIAVSSWSDRPRECHELTQPGYTRNDSCALIESRLNEWW